MGDDYELLTIQETADMLGVHAETLRRWDRSGKLKAVIVSDRGDRRYEKSAVLQFLNHRRNTHVLIYKEYEVMQRSYGFEPFPDRFGSIGRYIVKKDDLVTGFAFAVPGLERFAAPNITEKDLEAMAVEKIKAAIDQRMLKKLHEYTYEYHSSEFIQVNDPEWWKK